LHAPEIELMFVLHQRLLVQNLPLLKRYQVKDFQHYYKLITNGLRRQHLNKKMPFDNLEEQQVNKKMHLEFEFRSYNYCQH
jgi:hypothetical protein